MAISSIGPPPVPPAAGAPGQARESTAAERDHEPDEAGAEPEPEVVVQDPAAEADPRIDAEPEPRVAGRSAPLEPESDTEEPSREPAPGARLDVTA